MAHVRLTREQSLSQPCHVYISESVCCSVCCSFQHEWNAVWASVLFSRWCQPHVCTFPLLPDCTLRPPVCPSWLNLLLTSRHRPSHEGSCFANPYLTDSRTGAHLAWGISVRHSAARNAAGNSVTCISYCYHPAIITHPSPNDIFVLFSKSSSTYCATALWSISWNVMPLRFLLYGSLKPMLSSLRLLYHVPYGPIFLITAEFSHYWTQQAPWTVDILCNENCSGSFWDRMSFWDLMSVFLSLSLCSFIKLIFQPFSLNVPYLNSF